MKGWRTIGFNVVNILSAAGVIIALPQWHDVIPQAYLAWWLLGTAIANVVLRMVTTGPVGEK